MLQLHKDLFARLSISAKTLKANEFNNRLKQNMQKSSMSKLETLEYPEPADAAKIFEEKKTGSPKARLDDTVEKIIENPDVKALKKELEKVEGIFTKLKEKGEDLDIIMRIENKIEQLKRLIDEKSYV